MLEANSVGDDVYQAYAELANTYTGDGSDAAPYLVDGHDTVDPRFGREFIVASGTVTEKNRFLHECYAFLPSSSMFEADVVKCKAMIPDLVSLPEALQNEDVRQRVVKITIPIVREALSSMSAFFDKPLGFLKDDGTRLTIDDSFQQNIISRINMAKSFNLNYLLLFPEPVDNAVFSYGNTVRLQRRTVTIDAKKYFYTFWLIAKKGASKNVNANDGTEEVAFAE